MTVPSLPAIRILLVDNHTIVRAGLRLLIENRHGLAVVGGATNHADALALAAREQPDIIVLDLDLGTENGLDLLPKLHAVARDARVLILTGVREVEAHRQAVRHGAMGIVLKEQAPEVLLKAIEKVSAGEVWLDRALVVSVLSDVVGPAGPEAARIATLTKREREVSILVSEGLKNKQISERLSIAETTVHHHLTSIFDKFGVASRIELAIFAQLHGLTNWSQGR